MAQQTPLDFPIDLGYSICLTGRWSDGGILAVRWGTQPLKVIHLSRATWAVMALLARAAQESAHDDWGRAFVTVHELAAQLAKFTGIGARDPTNTIRLVFKLRKILAASQAHAMAGTPISGREWSMQLIEKQRFLGYRLGLPPESIELVILDD